MAKTLLHREVAYRYGPLTAILEVICVRKKCTISYVLSLLCVGLILTASILQIEVGHMYLSDIRKYTNHVHVSDQRGYVYAYYTVPGTVIDGIMRSFEKCLVELLLRNVWWNYC